MEFIFELIRFYFKYHYCFVLFQLLNALPSIHFVSPLSRLSQLSQGEHRVHPEQIASLSQGLATHLKLKKFLTVQITYG